MITARNNDYLYFIFYPYNFELVTKILITQYTIGHLSFPMLFLQNHEDL